MRIKVEFNYDSPTFEIDAEPGFKFNKGDVLIIKGKRHEVVGYVFEYGYGGMRGSLSLSQTIYVE